MKRASSKCLAYQGLQVCRPGNLCVPCALKMSEAMQKVGSEFDSPGAIIFRAVAENA